ncbi:uncharacterized protein [Mytilus edulis]|uniref:uncharacterized protein n=1 Tax=Mytilus edulis TaxID=6550 RepID=UPI0039EF70F8
MSNVRFLKGVRTRYRNSIQTEILNGKQILSSEVDKIDEQRFVLEATKCADKLKMYSEKLEIQSGKLASALEEEGEFIDDIVGEDCELCSNVMDCHLDLIQFKERLVDFIKKESIEVKESEFSSQIVELQREMKDIMQSQIKQQHEIFKKQLINENENSTCSIKLPKLDLSFLNGEKIKWMEFWDSFQSSVHSNTKLTDIEKFNYLWSKLQGEAKRAVSGLTLSSDNYSLAINILEERFGNKQDVIDIHYNQLINLPTPSNKISSLRDFIDKFNRHIRSLEVLKQDVNQDVFVSIIRSKLPEDVLLQLEIQKGAKAKLKISSLCEKLNDYVVAREKSCVTEKAKDSVKPNGFGNKFSPNPWKTNSFNNNRSENRVYQPKSSAEALIANSSKSQPGSKYFDKCRYCGSKHWSDECQKFKTIEERKRQLKGSGFKCLKAGHGSFECKRNKLCIHCNEVNSHHRSLCPKKFNTKNTCVYLSEEISEYCSDNVLQEFESTNNESEQESSMLAFGEMVLMQTATAEIANPNYTKKEKTRILFDSGSQRTYISQRLASKLGLKSYHEEEIRLMTFGSEKIKIVKTTHTNLDIRLKNGLYFSIIANIVPVISGCLNRRKLDSFSMTKLKKYVNDIYLADDLPFEN